MAKSRENSDSEEATGSAQGQNGIARKMPTVAVAALLVAVASLLFGPNIVLRIREAWIAGRPPDFEFLCEGVLEPNVCVYEVAEQLAYVDTDLGEFQIGVSSDYRGDEYPGAVVIQIRPGIGDAPVKRGEWEQFQMLPRETKAITLTASHLFGYAGLSDRTPSITPQEESATVSTGHFDIEVTHGLGGPVLATATITVVNSPWLHLTQLSDSTIRAGEPVTAYVTVRNLGGPADFKVVGILYDATMAVSGTLDTGGGSEGWWPSKSWARIDAVGQPTDHEILNNEEFTVALVVHGHHFQERHIYILETYVVKHLPYLQYPDGGWISSAESWRARDQPHYSTVVVLEP